MKKLVFGLVVAVGCLSAVHPASAQSGWGRRSSYVGPGSNPDMRYVQQTGSVPKFCYSLATGKFTHWGPCRRVLLPTGQWVKVAH